jgi:hypothetical protein
MAMIGGALAAVAGLWLLHRAACALEDRGHIYYRRGRGRAAMGAALSALEAELRPAAQHARAVEVAQPRRDADGDPPAT